jgi:hypothetical protein
VDLFGFVSFDASTLSRSNQLVACKELKIDGATHPYSDDLGA